MFMMSLSVPQMFVVSLSSAPMERIKYIWGSMLDKHTYLIGLR